MKNEVDVGAQLSFLIQIPVMFWFAFSLFRVYLLKLKVFIRCLSILHCFLVIKDLRNQAHSTYPVNTSPGYLPKYIPFFFTFQLVCLQWHLESSSHSFRKLSAPHPFLSSWSLSCI